MLINHVQSFVKCCQLVSYFLLTWTFSSLLYTFRWWWSWLSERVIVNFVRKCIYNLGRLIVIFILCILKLWGLWKVLLFLLVSICISIVWLMVRYTLLSIVVANMLVTSIIATIFIWLKGTCVSNIFWRISATCSWHAIQSRTELSLTWITVWISFLE